AGNVDDFDLATADVDDVSGLPPLGYTKAVGERSEAFGKRGRVPVVVRCGAGLRKIDHRDLLEARVAADVVVVHVRRDRRHGLLGDFVGNERHVARARPGIEQDRTLFAFDDVGDVLLPVVRLVDSVVDRVDLGDVEVAV